MLLKLIDNRVIGPVLLCIALIFFISAMLDFTSDQKEFIPGTTSDGHYQIELACEACHTTFEGVTKKTCLDCHREQLKEDDDSHAAKIFNDPRSFDLLAQIDAKNCLTCHAEHINQQIDGRVASLPTDFCYPCHKEVSTERPSHKNLAMDSCSASGCHNYHDNRALYEDFIAKHLGEPNTYANAHVPLRNIAEIHKLTQPIELMPLTKAEHDGGKFNSQDPDIIHQWAESSHARSGINCSDCHLNKQNNQQDQKWTNHPEMSMCESCHELEAKGFLAGKHGMRLSVDLTPMQPKMARLPMKEDAADKKLSCNSCHAAHNYNTQTAAVKSCLECHDDQHSVAYLNSPHYELWQQELSGTIVPGAGVSCATCHLPRLEHKQSGNQRILVNHNQNKNLSPNSKMIRSVCLDCHGYDFSLQALANPKLINNNFQSNPEQIVDTVDMVRNRLANKNK